MERKALIGVALMVVGTAMFIPWISPRSPVQLPVLLVVAAALLTAGTYLVGTSEEGRPV